MPPSLSTCPRRPPKRDRPMHLNLCVKSERKLGASTASALGLRASLLYLKICAEDHKLLDDFQASGSPSSEEEWSAATSCLGSSMVSRASAVGCHPLRQVSSLRGRGSTAIRSGGYFLVLQSGHGHWSQPQPVHASRIIPRRIRHGRLISQSKSLCSATGFRNLAAVHIASVGRTLGRQATPFLHF